MGAPDKLIHPRFYFQGKTGLQVCQERKFRAIRLPRREKPRSALAVVVVNGSRTGGPAAEVRTSFRFMFHGS